MELRKFKTNEIYSDMLFNFNHYDEVTEQWIKREDNWVLEEVLNIRQWSEEKKKWIAECYFPLHLERRGAIIGAFEMDRLLGFATVDGRLLGESSKYTNLSMLFVSLESKRKGIGSRLFKLACKTANDLGADKLYISAFTSKNTIAFYKKLECKDAQEIIEEFVDTPEDWQMEYILDNRE